MLVRARESVPCRDDGSWSPTSTSDIPDLCSRRHGLFPGRGCFSCLLSARLCIIARAHAMYPLPRLPPLHRSPSRKAPPHPRRLHSLYGCIRGAYWHCCWPHRVPSVSTTIYFGCRTTINHVRRFSWRDRGKDDGSEVPTEPPPPYARGDWPHGDEQHTHSVRPRLFPYRTTL